MFGWPNTPRYTINSILLWLAFLGAVAALAYGQKIGWPQSYLIGIALIPAVTVAIQFAMALKQFDGQDEFVRALTAKRMMAAAGLLIVLLTAWGSVSAVIPVPVLPLWLIYPGFWGLFGLVTPLINGTRA